MLADLRIRKISRLGSLNGSVVDAVNKSAGIRVASATLARIDQDRKRFKVNLVIAFAVLLVGLFAAMVVIGLNFKFMFNWLGFIMTGIGYTLLVSFLAITLACILSVLGALGRLSKNPVFYSVATAYVSLIRGTPLLVQIFLIYYGLGQFHNELKSAGLWWFFRDAFNCGLLAFLLNSASFGFLF